MRTAVEPDDETVAYHLKHPEVSIDQHFRKKVLEAGSRVGSRRSFYLDTRYWIFLRDADMGRARNAIHSRLLIALRAAVTEGRAICPFAADIFAEVLKQTDQATRRATAQVIDELSEGIALQPEKERVATEILHCVQRARRGESAVQPLKNLVWTAPAFVLGYVFPTWDGVPASEALAVQKSFTDSAWRTSLSEIIESLGVMPENIASGWTKLADRLNALNASHTHEIRSFKQLHTDEFAGVLEHYLPEISEIGPYLFHTELGGTLGPADAEQVTEAGRRLAALLREAFRRNRLGTQVPTMIIRSGLAAAVRWDRTRRYSANDFHDFGHAAAALPYFDCFATEKPLHNLITKTLKYDQQYGATVFHQPQSFLEAIEAS
jgi:hypothetical protein